MSAPAKYHAKVPPIKGAFPLDHAGECHREVFVYLNCLKENEQQLINCRELAKLYFECRMQAGLMTREEWSPLGFGDLDKTPNP